MHNGNDKGYGGAVRAAMAARFKSPHDLRKTLFSRPPSFTRKSSSAFSTANSGFLRIERSSPGLNSVKTTWLGEIPILITRGSDDCMRAFCQRLLPPRHDVGAEVHGVRHTLHTSISSQDVIRVTEAGPRFVAEAIYLDGMPARYLAYPL
jgi:hypothetical protein